MTLTGHETRAVFDRYNFVNEADLSSAVAKLAAFHARYERGWRRHIRDTWSCQPCLIKTGQ